MLRSLCKAGLLAQCVVLTRDTLSSTSASTSSAAHLASVCVVALTISGPPLAPATATSRPLALCVTMIGDMADSGRLPGAMKLALVG